VALTRLELEQLYTELEVPLYNFALRWVWNPMVAEEIVHDGFVRLWRARDNLHGLTIKGLVYKTVYNLCVNELRKQKWRDAIPFIVELMAHAGPSRGLNQHDQFVLENDLVKMRTALESLSKDLREVLLMTEFSDLSYDEVATILAIPVGTVASRKNRAMKELRDRMEVT
jgi:RNA polymerase sigma-70 factor, ECF subfamily